jgi:hypothetical protein
MASLLSHRRVLFASVGSALAVLAAVTAVPTAASMASTQAASVQRTLSAAPLGVNVATWDYVYYASSSVNVIQPLLKAAGIDQLRYGGGSVADAYDWQTNTDIENCLPGNPTASFTSSCASKDTLGFAQFSRQARAVGAQSLVTVNYGSGTPAEAAAWVRQAARASGQAVALWEVGNENYGCWEVNNELAGPPEHYQGYVPQGGDNQTCPMAAKGLAAGMQVMATSYAVNAKRFLAAMKAADPRAVIGVPWVFGSDGSPSPVAGGNEWNNTVLKADGKYVSFVDVHWYPFGFSGSTGGSNPADQQVLRSLFQVPSLAWQIRNELRKYDPAASFIVGEAGVSYNETLTACTPAGALFAAGDVLSWLAGGAGSVDWWDMNNYGNTGSRCTSPDDGLFTSAGKPVAETPYWGYRLASMLARPHARLGMLTTSDPADVLAYQSVLATGKHVVALINTNTAAARRVTFSAALSGALQTWRYSAGNQNAAKSKIVTGTAAAASVKGGITLPPESITILKTR